MLVMGKILIVLLVLFILFDVLLAFVFFHPDVKVSQISKLLPKNCEVVDSKFCKNVKIEGDEKLNETIFALFDLPKGEKVYAPASGQLDFLRFPSTKDVSEDQRGLPNFYIKGDDGTDYFFVFEPETEPQRKSVKVGEMIGITTGKRFSYLKESSLGVYLLKNQMSDKTRFDKLFR